MPRTALHVVPCLWIVASCWGCAAEPKEPHTALDVEPMSVQEAKHVVADIGTAGGLGAASEDMPPPASIAEVREIVRSDQLGRFDSARVYAARLSGVDALALRASLEALWADALLTVADLFHEVSLRRQSDLRTLKATRETLEPEQAESLIRERERQLREAKRNVTALRTLARPHLRAAEELAAEAQRQAPEATAGYLPGAHSSLLQREWTDFDLAIRKAERLLDDPSAYALYLRALERSMRFGQRAEARRMLEEVLAQWPELSRARARLLLLEDTPIERHAQLEKLKQHSPHHPIVVLAGPSIEREYVVSSELRAAAEGEAEATEPAPAAGAMSPNALEEGSSDAEPAAPSASPGPEQPSTDSAAAKPPDE